MIITGKKIDFFNDLLKDWQLKNDSETAQLERNMEQYLGSDVIDASQTGEDENADGNGVTTTPARAKVVRNITFELIESQISTVIPSPKVTPERWSEKHQRNAESIERLLTVLRDRTDSELMNDLDERLTPVHGASMRTVDWDESIITHDTAGDVRIQLMDISHLVWQPGVFNVQDMDCVFVRYDTTRSAVMERYGVSLPVAEATEPDEDSEYPDDTVTVWTAWYRDDEGEVCKYTFSASAELEDVDNYWSRHRRVCGVCGGRAEVCEDDENPGVCRCGGAIIDQPDEYEELTHDILDEAGNILIPAMSPVIRGGVIQTREERRPATDPTTGSTVMTFNALGLPEPVMETVQVPITEPTRIPWYRPKIYPICVRRNVSRNNSLLGQSDCAIIRPQQQATNKYESRILEKKLSEAFFPVKPQRSAFRYENSIGAKVLELAEGENKGDYGAISTVVDISGDMAASERCYSHAQRILGIPDSFTGQADSSAKSGLAKQVQVQQAAGRLASKRVMKSAAQAECDRAAFQLYLAYSDEPRPAPFTDDFGRVHNASFSRYDFVERDEQSGEYYYDDRYLFSADMSGTVAEDNEQMWELINSDFVSGLYGDPTQTVTLLRAWQARERARYPGAHKQVKYFTELLRQEVAMMREQAAAAQAQEQAQTPQLEAQTQTQAQATSAMPTAI